MDWTTVKMPVATNGKEFFKPAELENGAWTDIKFIKAKELDPGEVPPAFDQSKTYIKIRVELDGVEKDGILSNTHQIIKGLKNNNVQENEDFRLKRDKAGLQTIAGGYVDAYTVGKDGMAKAPESDEDVDLENIPF